MSPTSDEPARDRWSILCAAALAVLLVYGPSLDNGFMEIDDPTLLRAVRDGVPATPHFRPLYQAWNRLLHLLAGLTPGPYYLAGLALHTWSAFACGLLARRLASSAAAGVVAALVFAAFYSPHQAVLWIAANCGLLAVALALLAALAWHAHVRTGSRPAQALALLATAAASLSRSRRPCRSAGPISAGSSPGPGCSSSCWATWGCSSRSARIDPPRRAPPRSPPASRPSPKGRRRRCPPGANAGCSARASQ